MHDTHMLLVKAAGGTAIQTPPISTNIKRIRSNAGSRRWVGGTGNSRILRGRWATLLLDGLGVRDITVTVRAYSNYIPAKALRELAVQRVFGNMLSRTGERQAETKMSKHNMQLLKSRRSRCDIVLGVKENAPCNTTFQTLTQQDITPDAERPVQETVAKREGAP